MQQRDFVVAAAKFVSIIATVPWHGINNWKLLKNHFRCMKAGQENNYKQKYIKLQENNYKKHIH